MVSWMSIIGTAILGFSSLELVAGHMQLFSPIPRADPRNKGYGAVDYNLNAPLNAINFPGPFPCRHQKVGPVTGKYTAGKSFTASFHAGNSHKGGHCQFALSYDNGKNWVVLKTIIDLCFLGSAPYSYHIPLPKGAKNGPAVFGWTWLNAEGNREYYMNCADVEISGGSDTGSLTGPELFVAQLEGKPQIPQWANTDGKHDGKEYFPKRKIVTIPIGSTSTRDGTVVGEPGDGKQGAVASPERIPWEQFSDDRNVRRDDSDTQFTVAISDGADASAVESSSSSSPSSASTSNSAPEADSKAPQIFSPSASTYDNKPEANSNASQSSSSASTGNDAPELDSKAASSSTDNYFNQEYNNLAPSTASKKGDANSSPITSSDDVNAQYNA
ncbi:hypothetical protein BDF19DRAFT_411728 [Syncephalis fuscata]|nr:hypothetical protein BDF19DRAFT_411728 [Syncephalis fuscata]